MKKTPSVSNHSQKPHKTSSPAAPYTSGCGQTRANRRPKPIRFAVIPDLRNGALQKGELVLVPAETILRLLPELGAPLAAALAENAEYLHSVSSACQIAATAPASRPHRPLGANSSAPAPKSSSEMLPGPSAQAPANTSPAATPASKHSHGGGCAPTHSKMARKTSPHSTTAAADSASPLPTPAPNN